MNAPTLLLAVLLVLLAMPVAASQTPHRIEYPLIHEDALRTAIGRGRASIVRGNTVVLPRGDYTVYYHRLDDVHTLRLPRRFPRKTYWIATYVAVTPPRPRVVYKTRPAPVRREVVYVDRPVTVKVPVATYIDRPVLPKKALAVVALLMIAGAFVVGIALGREWERTRITHLKLSIPELDALTDDLYVKATQIARRTVSPTRRLKG